LGRPDFLNVSLRFDFVSAQRRRCTGISIQPLVENHRHFLHLSPVRLTGFIALFLTATFLAGCKKSGGTAATPPSLDDLLPKQAQPKLPTMKIYLGAETLDAELALNDREWMTGMMFRTNIAETDAMLFVFSRPYRVSFWMKNCPESLSAAYIGPDGVIEEIRHLEKNDTNSVVAATDNIQYVLETKDGWFTRHNVGPGTVIRTGKGSLQETFFSQP
jgi:uncharacterized membrane protein (UPF0127 family)